MHLHFLLAGNPTLGSRECERDWFRRAGTAVIAEYDNQVGAAHYCAGHIDEAGLEYHFSDNLSAFRAPTNLTDSMKINDIGPDAVVCRNDKHSGLLLEEATEPRSSVHTSPTSTKDVPVCQGWNDEGEEQKHNEKNRDETDDEEARENDQETRNSNANPSTRRRDSAGGTNMRQMALDTVATEMAERHKQLSAQWAKTKGARDTARKEMLIFGRLCDEARALELHKCVRKPGSRKGYVSFEKYIDDITGGQLAKSKLYQAIGIYQLTTGSNALTESDVAEMSAQNAYILRTRLEPERRTPDIVEAAKKTSKREFPAKVQAKLNEYLPPEQQRTPRVDCFRKLHPKVANKLEETIERFIHLPIARDGDTELTLHEKAIYAICNAAEQFAAEDLMGVEEKSERDPGDLADSGELVGVELFQEPRIMRT